MRTLTIVAAAALVCPTCGAGDLEVEPTLHTHMPRAVDATNDTAIAMGCAGCGFSAEKTPTDFVVHERGTREVGFDKRAYRRRLAALATVAVAA